MAVYEKIKIENTEENNEEVFDFDKMYNDTLVDVEAKLEKQPTAISIGEVEDYKGDPYAIPFGSYGDYSCIIGPSKAKKSFMKSILAASYIGGNSNNHFPNIKGHDFEGKVVLDFDTEQSVVHTQRVGKRVKRMVGHLYPNYYLFSLRPYSPEYRIKFIESVLEKFKGRIGLVCIDGYADLLVDFNNLGESVLLTNKLLLWPHKYNCHITGILHTNYGSNKPVGHLGSTVLKKAECIVRLEEIEADNCIKVHCSYARNMKFDDFFFNVRRDWLPYEYIPNGGGFEMKAFK